MTPPVADPPAHVLAEPGAKRALCGLKDPLPQLWEPWVRAHIEGHGMEVCPACDALRDRTLDARTWSAERLIGRQGVLIGEVPIEIAADMETWEVNDRLGPIGENVKGADGDG